MIETDKPLMIGLGFSLRPNLARASRIVGARLYEIQTAAANAGARTLLSCVVGVIRNHQRELFRGLISSIERYRQCFFCLDVIELELRSRLRELNLGNIHRCRVEIDTAQVFNDW